ncbi:zf-U1-domain-containing protein [Piromyces finnis]|uniref:U1 small nuclear ribonucleoprotein C n=1 Tax=Piromyces finnis TaxID=1754191 RepID=A0A1Y1UYN8_9FUNG|nr:zf-U1-domain-containing protein [Piromyces finnis]|eukprot:ORX43635.1 zf-U1-domain-containing protein [Piromyces finnis]
MPKYYCDYCDVFLTHDSSSVRKSHNAGWKHKTQVQNYYNALGKDKIQEVIDQITRNKNDYNFPPLLMPFAKPGMVLPPKFPSTPGTNKNQKQSQQPNPLGPPSASNPATPANPNQPPFPIPPFGKPPGMIGAPGAPGAPGLPIPGMPSQPIDPTTGMPASIPGMQSQLNKPGFPPNLPPPPLGGIPTGAPGIPVAPGVTSVPGTLPPPGLPVSFTPMGKSENDDKDSPNKKRAHEDEENHESVENKKAKY